MGNQHIIELNGKRYDAQTGKLLPATEVPVHKAQPSQSPHQSMDGFVKKTHHAPRHVANTQVAHHQPEKSSTLMRKSVKKPTPITHLTKHVSQLKEAVIPTTSMPSEVSVHSAPAERLDRAEQIRRSKLIQRFGGEVNSAKSSHKATGHQAAHVAVAAISQPISEIPSEADNAIENAFSHTQPKVKRTPAHHRVAKKLRLSPRALSISTAVMAFMVLGGFFAYSNIPNMSMRVADMRSNVKGTLPAYKPAGFALSGPIKYQPGEIVVAYKSNSDSRSYEITQKASSWDIESLQNSLNDQKIAYQTVQQKGKTIFLYDDSDATWVDGGVLYKLAGNSNLNTDQVLHIADSL